MYHTYSPSAACALLGLPHFPARDLRAWCAPKVVLEYIVTPPPVCGENHHQLGARDIASLSTCMLWGALQSASYCGRVFLRRHRSVLRVLSLAVLLLWWSDFVTCGWIFNIAAVQLVLRSSVVCGL